MTGDERLRYVWVCELSLPASAIADLPLVGCELSRGLLSAQSAREALGELARKSGREVRVKRSGVLLAGRIQQEDCE